MNESDFPHVAMIQDCSRFKDAELNVIATNSNVAQFVSFSPSLTVRYSRIREHSPNSSFATPREALSELVKHSGEGRINFRSFSPHKSQGNAFYYGLTSIDEAETVLRRLGEQGFFIIANETVDVNDRGVSGAVEGGLIEFAPGDTPRVVEGGDIACLRLLDGMELLESVYGFRLELGFPEDYRVEFSVHPVRRGYSAGHTIIWEAGPSSSRKLLGAPRWPNAFSRFIGDKTFGLLMAVGIGLTVPKTIVISRTVEPFSFGEPTGSDVKWMRTCPSEPRPGIFPTVRGWSDPFDLLRVDSDRAVASILVQEEVQSVFSGAMLTGKGVVPIIEGVSGFGDELMLGRELPIELPREVTDMLERLHQVVVERYGSVRLEWAYDGCKMWILQLQQEDAVSTETTIVPGEADEEVEFDVAQGLAALQELIDTLENRSCRVRLMKRVGITSHFADLLRRRGIPSTM